MDVPISQVLELNMDVRAPQAMEEIGEVAKLISQERKQQLAQQTVQETQSRMCKSERKRKRKTLERKGLEERVFRGKLRRRTKTDPDWRDSSQLL